MSWGISACGKCLDCPTVTCKKCACTVCGGKHSEDTQVMCDECDEAFHIACLDPPLDSMPEGNEWYIINCSSFLLLRLFHIINISKCIKPISNSKVLLRL
jgi:hypothetical protein